METRTEVEWDAKGRRKAIPEVEMSKVGKIRK